MGVLMEGGLAFGTHDFCFTMKTLEYTVIKSVSHPVARYFKRRLLENTHTVVITVYLHTVQLTVTQCHSV